MARSFSNVKLISAFVVDEVSIAINRRGYAAASQGVAASGGGVSKTNVMVKKQVEESGTKSPWVPDPKTGYYRPENLADEIDVAELRQVLLKQRTQ